MRHAPALLTVLALASLLVVAGCDGSENPIAGDQDTVDGDNDPADGDTDNTDLDVVDNDLDDLPVFDHDPGDVSGSVTWTRGIHNVTGSIRVVGGTLTIEACSVVRMAPQAAISMDNLGALRMVGRADCPITVTSAKSVPAAGDWGRLDFWGAGDSGASVFQHVVIEFGGHGGDYGTVWIGDGASVAVSDTTIRSSGGAAIFLDGGAHLRGFERNILTGNQGAAVELTAGSVADLGVGTYAGNGAGIVIHGGDVTEDATWRGLDAPFVLDQSIAVRSETGSARLTLSGGATVAMGPDTVIGVWDGGGLTIDGTAEAPVTVTSAKSSPAAGDWRAIEFWDNSTKAANVIRHAVIEFGGRGNAGLIWVASGTGVSITDSVLRHSSDVAIQLDAEADLMAFTGNTVTGNVAGALRLQANQVHQLGAGTYGPNGTEGVIVAGGIVRASGTWIDLGVPLLIAQTFDITSEGASAIVTVAAGSVLHMGPDTAIRVLDHGGLVLAGVEDDPILIQSGKAAPSPGDWAQIEVWEGSVGAANRATYTTIRHGGGGGYGAIWVAGNASIGLDHVTFGDNATCDVYPEADATVNASDTDWLTCN